MLVCAGRGKYSIPPGNTLGGRATALGCGVIGCAARRAGRRLTQEQVAEALGVSQANVSQIEHQDNIYLRTLSSYIEALGGQLEVRAVFPDETVVLVLPGAGVR